MNETYQAIYEAVRSRIHSVDIGDVIHRVAYDAFNLSYARAMLQEQIHIVGNELSRPSAIYRPTLSKDGDYWCALYGDDPQTGVSGFGLTPDLAMRDFDMNWRGQHLEAERSEE